MVFTFFEEKAQVFSQSSVYQACQLRRKSTSHSCVIGVCKDGGSEYCGDTPRMNVQMEHDKAKRRIHRLTRVCYALYM